MYKAKYCTTYTGEHWECVHSEGIIDFKRERETERESPNNSSSLLSKDVLASQVPLIPASPELSLGKPQPRPSFDLKNKIAVSIREV